ncbi:hypothetical protein TNCV_2093721, partial [Trichonephila clavipes]
VNAKADLPIDQVKVSRVFTKVGIDYAGPFFLNFIQIVWARSPCSGFFRPDWSLRLFVASPLVVALVWRVFLSRPLPSVRDSTVVDLFSLQSGNLDGPAMDFTPLEEVLGLLNL